MISRCEICDAEMHPADACMFMTCEKCFRGIKEDRKHKYITEYGFEVLFDTELWIRYFNSRHPPRWLIRKILEHHGLLEGEGVPEGVAVRPWQTGEDAYERSWEDDDYDPDEEWRYDIGDEDFRLHRHPLVRP